MRYTVIIFSFFGMLLYGCTGFLGVPLNIDSLPEKGKIYHGCGGRYSGGKAWVGDGYYMWLANYRVWTDEDHSAPVLEPCKYYLLVRSRGKEVYFMDGTGAVIIQADDKLINLSAIKEHATKYTTGGGYDVYSDYNQASNSSHVSVYKRENYSRRIDYFPISANDIKTIVEAKQLSIEIKHKRDIPAGDELRTEFKRFYDEVVIKKQKCQINR